MRRKIQFRTALFSIFIVGGIVAGCRSEQKTKEKPIVPAEVSTHKSKLYTFTMETTEGTISKSKDQSNLQMAHEDLINCVEMWCNSAYGVGRYYGDVLTFPLYLNYKKAVCISEKLETLLSGTEKLELDNASGFGLNVGLLQTCVGDKTYKLVMDMSSAGNNELQKVAFSDANEPENRARLRKQSTFALSAAFQNATEFLSDSAALTNFVNSEITMDAYWAPDPLAAPADQFDEKSVVNDVANSLSSIVSKIVSQGKGYILELINQGIASDDQWFNDDYGRKAALATFFKVSGCKSDETYEPDSGICWKKCPIGYEFNQVSDTCKKVSTEVLELEEARSICEAEGGRLPTINDVVSIFSGETCTNYDYATTQTTCQGGVGSLPNDACHMICNANTQNQSCMFHERCSGIFGARMSSGLLGKYMYLDSYDSGSFQAESMSIHFRNSAPCEPSMDSSYYCFQKELFAPVCVRDQGEADMKLLPEEEISALPRETPSLKKAVSLLADNKVNFIGFGQRKKTGFTAFTEKQLENAIVARVNATRSEVGLPEYSSFSAITESMGIALGDMLDAVDYMYAHSILFPRDLNFAEGTQQDIDSKLDGWYNPYTALPPEWYIAKNLTSETFKSADDTGIPQLSDISISLPVALLPTVYEFLDDVQASSASLGNTSGFNEVQQAFSDVRRAMFDLLGGDKYDYIADNDIGFNSDFFKSYYQHRDSALQGVSFRG
ncbi:MAG: hypothetical protein JXR76_29055 [Deltaproteobacteria bacterium]|nr:hypothetical protein [Deltaproteobacteria bacterium]